MKNRPKSATTKFQQNFQTQLTFKRNKRYIDFKKVSKIDHQFSTRRRKPIKSEAQTLYTKIHTSFMNSTAELTEKVERNIDKFRNRLSQMDIFAGMEDEETPRTSRERKQGSLNDRVQSFSMEKMTSREYLHKLKNKPVPDERLFNNFKETVPDEEHTRQFSKSQGKKLDNRLKHMNDIYHETQKLYEQYYYKKSGSSCKVNYNAEKKLNHDRVFFREKRPQNKPATDLSPKNVDKGRLIVTQNKNKNINSNKIDSFYMNSGRQLPSQMGQRQMNQLTNHWRNEDKKIKRPKLDFGTRLMKESLKDERLEKIKQSKRAQIREEEMCSDKYYRYHRKYL